MPTFRVTFSGYFSGIDTYFCGFLLWDRCICLHPFPGPTPLTYICTLHVNNTPFRSFYRHFVSGAKSCSKNRGLVCVMLCVLLNSNLFMDGILIFHL